MLRKLNAAKGGGYIFQSDHSVSSAVSGQTYDYIVKLVREFGNYPINWPNMTFRYEMLIAFEGSLWISASTSPLKLRPEKSWPFRYRVMLHDASHHAARLKEL